MACCAIVNISKHPCTNARFISCGAVQAIVCAMRKHSTAATLQYKACCALRNLTCAVQAVSDMVEQGGVTHALVSSMNLHLLRAGMWARPAA
jgi:hypothetical protein